MSETQKVKVTYEYLDENGRWCNNRVLVFTGEVSLSSDGRIEGIIHPLYSEVQKVNVEGSFDPSTGVFDLKAFGPRDVNRRPWEPEEAYLWSVTHAGHMGFYTLPEHLHGMLIQTAEGVWGSEMVDRKGGKKAGVQLTF